MIQKLMKPIFNEELGELFIDLTFLSQVQRGEKISFNTYQIHDSTSYFESIKRFIIRDSRKDTIDNIKQILVRANVLYWKYPNYSDDIVGKLKEARSGVYNLIYTYESDPYLKSELRVVIDIIDSLTSGGHEQR